MGILDSDCCRPMRDSDGAAVDASDVEDELRTSSISTSMSVLTLMPSALGTRVIP